MTGLGAMTSLLELEMAVLRTILAGSIGQTKLTFRVAQSTRPFLHEMSFWLTGTYSAEGDMVERNTVDAAAFLVALPADALARTFGA